MNAPSMATMAPRSPTCLPAGTRRRPRAIMATLLLAVMALTVAGCASSSRTSYEQRGGSYYGYDSYYGDGWGRGYHRGYHGGGYYGRPRGYRGRW